MPNNYVLLERIELNASTASVTFASIPQTGYTDLKVVVSARSDYAGVVETCNLQINGVTTATYPSRYVQGDGAAASSATTNISGSVPIGVVTGNTATSSTFGSAEIYLPNYTDSSNYQSLSGDSVSENNATTSYTRLSAGLWQNNAAITTIAMFPYLGTNWLANSTFSLYGLAALGTTPAIAPKAAGGSIYTDGTYWYHAFRTSGTFTPQISLSCDALVVAGGGGGGAYVAGGGGAGGVYYTSTTLAATAQTVTIGAGGAPSAGNPARGSNGTNSVLGSLTAAVGGGGGGSSDTSAGLSGGSGGGAGSTVSTASGGSATSGQGFAGGNTSGFSGAGGGGAGAAAANAGATNTATAGGAGTNTYSSWLSATNTGVSGYIAGGGGGGNYTAGSGGAGGAGGGAAGASNNVQPGTATINTGGGGGAMGGGGSAPIGSAGASGLVIIRYTI